MEVDAFGRDARKGVESLLSWTAEHEDWKFAVLQDVVADLDAIGDSVKNGVSVSAARMHGLLQIALQLAKLAGAIGVEDGTRSVYAHRLTARQGEIMLLLDTGMKPKEIAQQLTLSEATVRTHIRNARRLFDSKRTMIGGEL